MEQEKDYNLTGLKLLFYGMIIQLVANILNGIISAHQVTKVLMSYTGVSGIMLTIIVAAINIVAVVIIVMGLAKTQKYTARFREAKMYYIIDIALISVAYILSAATIGLMASRFTGHKAVLTVIAGFSLILFIAGIAALIFNLLAVRGTMFGCSDIAIGNGNQKLQRSCKRMWHVYLASFLLMMVFVIVIVSIMMFNVNLTSSSGKLAYWVGHRFGGGTVLAIIFLLASMLFYMIMQLLVIFRVRAIYKIFNGRPLPGAKPMALKHPAYEPSEIHEVVSVRQPETPEVVVTSKENE